MRSQRDLKLTVNMKDIKNKALELIKTTNPNDKLPHPTDGLVNFSEDPNFQGEHRPM